MGIIDESYNRRESFRRFENSGNNHRACDNIFDWITYKAIV